MGEPLGRLVSRWSEVQGLAVHALVSTDPLPRDVPDVVLVHGAGLSHRYLVPTAERLAAYARVWVPDLPGHGESDAPGHVLTIPELADALAAWMESVGLEQAALLGNSMGCQTIAHLAVRHPVRVERAVLQGPITDPRARTPWQQWWRWFRKMNRENPRQNPINRQEYREAGARRVLIELRYSLFEDRIEEVLPHVKAPVLVVRGSGDTIVPQRWAEEVTRLLPNGRLVVVPGAMHTMNFQQPLELVRVSVPFLLESAGGGHGVGTLHALGGQTA